MNWLDLSDIKQHLGTLERRGLSLRSFASIEIGTFEIDPYVDLYIPSILDSKQVDITICHDNILVHPLIDPLFQHFQWASYFTERRNIGKGIPIDEVCQIIKDVYRVSRLEVFN